MNCIHCGVWISSPSFCGKHHPKNPKEMYHRSQIRAVNKTFASINEAEEYLSANRSARVMHLVIEYALDNGYNSWASHALSGRTYRRLFASASAQAFKGWITVAMYRVPPQFSTLLSQTDISDEWFGPVEEDGQRLRYYTIRWNAWKVIGPLIRREFPAAIVNDVLLNWKEYVPPVSSMPEHIRAISEDLYTSLVYVNRGWFNVGEYILYEGDIYRSKDLFNDLVEYDKPPWGFGVSFNGPTTVENLDIIIKSDQPDDVKIDACVELMRIIENRAAIADSFTQRLSTERYDSSDNGSLHRFIYKEEQVAGPKMRGANFSLIPKFKKIPILEEWEDYLNFYKPYSQQKIMAQLVYRARYLPLWVDMRVGKTNSAIMAARRMLEEKLVDHVIVVAPAMLMYEPWFNELEKQGCFRVTMLDGTIAEAEADLAAGESDFYIVSWSSLPTRLRLMQEHLDMHRLMWIGDETSAIKSHRSLRAKAARLATRDAFSVVALNGTPISQGAQDIWSQQMFVDQGQTFGQSFARFSINWLQKVSATRHEIKKSARLAFEVTLASSSYRCLRSEADQFLGRNHTMRYISFHASKEMREEYNNIIEGYTTTADGDEVAVKANILTVYGHLRECCAGHKKHETFENSGEYVKIPFEINPKVIWIRTFLKSNPGQPLVISSESSMLEDRIMKMLEDEGIPYSSLRPIGSKTPYSAREKAEQANQFNDGFTRVMLLKSVQGKGLTLNRNPAVKAGRGTYPVMIFAQPTFSLLDFEQMRDRCVGTNPKTGRSINTMVYFLMIAGSIEEKIVKALRSKKNVSEQLLNDAARDGYENPFAGIMLGGSKFGHETFDTEEMGARYELGIGPQQRLSETMIRKHDKRYQARAKGIRQKDVTELSPFAEILMEKIK